MKLNLQITKTAFTEVPKNHNGGRGEKGDIRRAIEALAVNEKAQLRYDASTVTEGMKSLLRSGIRNAIFNSVKKEADGRKYCVRHVADGADVYRIA